MKKKKHFFYDRRIGSTGPEQGKGFGWRRAGASVPPEGVIGGNRKQYTFWFSLQVPMGATAARIPLSVTRQSATFHGFFSVRPMRAARDRVQFPVQQRRRQISSAQEYRAVRVPRFHYWPPPPPPLGARQSIIRRKRSAACGLNARARSWRGTETDGLLKGINAIHIRRVVRTRAIGGGREPAVKSGKCARF